MRTSNVTFQLRKLYLDTSFSRETTSLVNCSISSSIKKGLQLIKRPDADRDHLQSIIQHVRDCDPAN
jgi:hypothetical protein